MKKKCNKKWRWPCRELKIWCWKFGARTLWYFFLWKNIFLNVIYIADMANWMCHFDNFDIDQIASKLAQRWNFVHSFYCKKISVLDSFDNAKNAKRHLFFGHPIPKAERNKQQNKETTKEKNVTHITSQLPFSPSLRSSSSTSISCSSSLSSLASPPLDGEWGLGEEPRLEDPP